MNFAGRMNSFIFQKEKDLYETIDAYHKIEGITHLEFNYPEHIQKYDLEKLKQHIGDMKVNGVAMRFKDHFINGEFTNSDPAVRQDAIKLCREGVDACAALNGKVLTVWQAYDGFDYPFTMQYEDAWDQMIEAYREVADYAAEKSIEVSIEYKPYEPRNYAMVDSAGTTLLAIKEIGRKNVGMTLDICHMLMKHDSPAMYASMALRQGKLFGMHLNDGYAAMDSGLIFGSVNLVQCLELVYFLKKYDYQRTLFFDTFPIREKAAAEVSENIRAFKRMSEAIDAVGMEQIGEIISQHDGVAANALLLDLLR